LSASLNGNFNFNAPKGTNFIFKYGNMGIGDLTATRAKLHIKASDTEDATLLLETTGVGKLSRIYFTDQHYISALTNDNFTFRTQSGKNFVFENGNVGIGTATTPTEKLEVIGKVKSTLLQVTTGFGSGKLLQSDASGNAVWTDPAWKINGTIVSSLSGTVGIGTDTPMERFSLDAPWARPINFHLGGSQAIFSNAYYDGTGILRVKDGTAYGIVFSNVNLSINTAVNGLAGSTITWNKAFTISPDGNIGIGTENTYGYKLAVAGSIIAQELKIVLSVPASDFVFEKDYSLMPLTEVEQFILDNKHLPEVPSAADFKADGYSVGQMDDLLLRKIEELTLYIISQQKEIEQLKMKINIPD